MDEDQLNDLKQFIAGTVSQATADMATKEDMAKLATKEDLSRVERKVDDIDLKVDTISEALNDNINNHEARLTKLEQQTA